MDHEDMYTVFGRQLVHSLVTTDKNQSNADRESMIDDAVSEATAFVCGHLKGYYDFTPAAQYWDAALRKCILNRAMFALACTRPSRQLTLNAKGYLDLSEKTLIDIKKGDLKLGMDATFSSHAEVIGENITDGVYTGDAVSELLGFEWSWEDYYVCR